MFWYTVAVDGIRDLLTDICLVGAAATSVAWVVLINRGRMARAADRIAKTSRSAVAAFLFFAAIATVCAQKRGMGIENGELIMENGGVVAAGDSTILHFPLYILHSNEVVRDEKWWLRGKRECKMENVEWRMCA